MAVARTLTLTTVPRVTPPPGKTKNIPPLLVHGESDEHVPNPVTAAHRPAAPASQTGVGERECRSGRACESASIR